MVSSPNHPPAAAPHRLQALPPAGLDALIAQARQQGWQIFHLALQDARLDHALVALGRSLAFPEWYGANLDALADCLGDLSWLPETGLVLCLTGGAAMAREAPQDWLALQEVLQDAATTWAATQRPFQVYLDPPPGHP
ncbi:barstar family protein [Azospira inquinata]|uniref:Barstar family protein n=1 Tax=Azospira inquinata TaxID=2785627 RepID=A0A975SQ49_9RHOO|nr:barstar family protein [Azospira inquinata]QWT47480.1 barstar family protein [Azospira inquinata]QWT49895.1 barstar family protein [Azospira inquinata]